MFSAEPTCAEKHSVTPRMMNTSALCSTVQVQCFSFVVTVTDSDCTILQGTFHLAEVPRVDVKDGAHTNTSLKHLNIPTETLCLSRRLSDCSSNASAASEYIGDSNLRPATVRNWPEELVTGKEITKGAHVKLSDEYASNIRNSGSGHTHHVLVGVNGAVAAIGVDRQSCQVT